MVILISLLVTCSALSLVLIVLSFKMIRRLTTLQRLETRLEGVSNGLALLTETTESGFQWTSAELKRITALQHRSHWPDDVQLRLKRAAALGESAQRIAGEEGLPESEVQLRMHLANRLDFARLDRTQEEMQAGKEEHVGTV